jgi:hypothetical protein
MHLRKSSVVVSVMKVEEPTTPAKFLPVGQYGLQSDSEAVDNFSYAV